MTLYICLDDRDGLQFNKRRQSRDAAVLEDIRSQLTGNLLIDPFSEKLIREAEIPYVLPPETAEPSAIRQFWNWTFLELPAAYMLPPLLLLVPPVITVSVNIAPAVGQTPKARLPPYSLVLPSWM